MDEQTQKDVIEFNRMRQQLGALTAQMQQLQLQSDTLKTALEELKQSKEEKVYKAVGNILVLKKSKDVEKEIKENKESTDLRVKTLKKQEESSVQKLNKLRSKIESKIGSETALETSTASKKNKNK